MFAIKKQIKFKSTKWNSKVILIHLILNISAYQNNQNNNVNNFQINNENIINNSLQGN